MTNSRNPVLAEDRNPFLMLLMLFAFVCVGLFVAAIFTALLTQLFGMDISTTNLTNADSSDWWSLMIMQGLTSISLFLLAPVLFIIFHLRSNPISFFFRQEGFQKAALLTAAATFCFMIVNSVFIEWNKNVEFPEFLKSFEEFARANEDKLAELTTFLTTFDGPGQFVMALVVIAGIAAVGEELLFRGVLQPIFQKMFNNHHVAIWLTGLIFAAIHMQFFGFVPRMFLGVLFGYFYHYSGNIIYPMIAHFINNGLSIVLVYLYNLSMIEYDIEDTESIPLYVVAVFALAFGYAFFSFLKQFSNQPSNE